MRKYNALFLAVLSTSFHIPKAQGAPYFWGNFDGGNFEVASNWVPNGVPGSGDGVNFSSGFASGIYNVVFNADRTNFALNVFDTQPDFFLASRTWTLNSASTDPWGVGLDSGEHGGFATVHGGTINVNASNGFGTVLGKSSNSDGALTLKDNTTFNCNGLLDIGRGGSASMQIISSTATVMNGLTLGGTNSGVGLLSLQPGSMLREKNFPTYVGLAGNGTVLQSDNSTHDADFGIVLGAAAGAIGVYSMSGGTFLGGDSIVGRTGAGTWTQSAGTSNFSSLDAGGDFGSGKGTINLSGGTFIVGHTIIQRELHPNIDPDNDVVERIGAAGAGTFNHTGGLHQVLESLVIGRSSGSTGLYNLNESSGSAELDVAHTMFVGDLGAGTFNQTAASVFVNALSVGSENAPVIQRGTGTCLLAGSFTVTTSANVGDGGNGYVDQKALSSVSAQTLSIGNGTLGVGQYFVRGGASTSVNTLVVGDFGTGSFSQSAGSGIFGLQSNVNVATSCFVGRQASSAGTISLTGGSLTVAGTEYVGFNGGGTLTQAGGTNAVGLGLHIAASSGSTGACSMSGGTLSTQQTVVGEFGTATFSQSGGTHTAGPILPIFTPQDAFTVATQSGSKGTYVLSGGTLRVLGDASVGGFHFNGGGFAGGIGTLIINSTGNMSVTGKLTAWNNGTLQYNGGALVVAGALEMQGGKLTETTNGSRLLKAGSVATSAGGIVDLNDNDMQVTGGSTYAQITSQIVSARAGGAWTGSGITSTAARNASPKVTTLGVLTGQQFHTAQGAGATFDGSPVASADLLVKYTYYGDTDLNGKVDGADYARVDATFNNEATQGNIAGWFNGDVDYSGKVDGADYALIDSAFNAQGGTLLRMLSFMDGTDRNRRTMRGMALGEAISHFDQFGESYAASVLASVPEPTNIVLIGALAASAARVRRRIP